MVVLEEFYHLVEANHFTISGVWKILPMIFILVASLCGIIYAFTFGRFKERFSKRCVFFSYFYTPSSKVVRTYKTDSNVTPQHLNVTLSTRRFNISDLPNNLSQIYNEHLLPSAPSSDKLINIIDENDNITKQLRMLHIDRNDYQHVYYFINKTINGTYKQVQETRIELPNLADIYWSEDCTCDYLQFTPLMCSIFGITILSFFVMFGKGGNSATNGLRSPWRIVAPSLIATIIFSILTIITLNYLNKGILTFCKNFVQNYDKMPCSEVLNTVSRRLEMDNVKMLMRNDGYLLRHGLKRMPDGSVTMANNSSESVSHRVMNTVQRLNETNHFRWFSTHELYYMSELILAIGMSAWILCAVFLIIRIVTIIDFQLIKVTISTTEKKAPSKYVKFRTPQLHTIFSRQDDFDENEPFEEIDTEIELLSHSPDAESSITLASPDVFDEEDTEDSSYELIDLKPKMSKHNSNYDHNV